ncbi:biotin transporter BioY [Aureimonas endophytica]|uniref:Biotin transporter n=1 Tax=Aureimonas endophytica TaxID=2027858 RepID=A0A917EA94_9HYPH|nr:biotin transporter BioY [Aureimonas endophytica]GGE18642.1 biotin transporter BioY [Aureimonas endophytica]
MRDSMSLPLVERFWPAAGAAQQAARAVALIAAGSLLLYASAKTAVPFWPVKMSMQTLAVVLIGATYGSRLGVATLLAYLAEGALGLPVFQGTPERGIGLAYMMGPTGGYLLGFVLAAALIGFVVERGYARSLPAIALAALAAHAVIDGFGVAWLSVLFGFEKAVAVGLLPFLLGDLLKAALATALIMAMRPRAAR